jgi:hypothetical protein
MDVIEKPVKADEGCMSDDSDAATHWTILRSVVVKICTLQPSGIAVERGASPVLMLNDQIGVLPTFVTV